VNCLAGFRGGPTTEHEPRRFMHSSPCCYQALDQIRFTEYLLSPSSERAFLFCVTFQLWMKRRKYNKKYYITNYLIIYSMLLIKSLLWLLNMLTYRRCKEHFFPSLGDISSSSYCICSHLSPIQPLLTLYCNGS